MKIELSVSILEIKIGDEVEIAHPLTGVNHFREVSEIDFEDCSIKIKDTDWNFYPINGSYIVRRVDNKVNPALDNIQGMFNLINNI